MVLCQDSAPGHVAKDTMSFMKEHNINVIMPHVWLPKSSDAAPMDYSISVVYEGTSTIAQSVNTERTKKCYKRWMGKPLGRSY